MAKKHRDLMRALRDAGWRHKQGKSMHNKFYCPCGEHMVVTGDTPSDTRAWKNFAGDIRRTGCLYLPKGM